MRSKNWLRLSVLIRGVRWLILSQVTRIIHMKRLGLHLTRVSNLKKMHIHRGTGRGHQHPSPGLRGVVHL